MSFNKEEFKMVQTLAWDILIDGHICEMPVKITNIAKVYNFEKTLDYAKSRWDNCKVLSSLILEKYGFHNDEENSNLLCIRILAPMCIIRECKIANSNQLSAFCDIPIKAAESRYNRFVMLLERNKFYTSDMEVKVKRQFEPFIEKYLEQNED